LVIKLKNTKANKEMLLVVAATIGGTVREEKNTELVV